MTDDALHKRNDVSPISHWRGSGRDAATTGRYGARVDPPTVEIQLPVEIQVLGPVRVFLPGSEVRLPGWACPTLLAILVFDAGENSRRRLVEEIWGEGELVGGVGERRAMQRLYAVTSALKRLLGETAPQLLDTDRGKGTLELIRSGHVSIDYDDFCADLREGRRNQAALRLAGREVCQGLELPTLTGYRQRVRDELDGVCAPPSAGARAKARGANPTQQKTRDAEFAGDSELTTMLDSFAGGRTTSR